MGLQELKTPAIVWTIKRNEQLMLLKNCPLFQNVGHQMVK